MYVCTFGTRLLSGSLFCVGPSNIFFFFSLAFPLACWQSTNRFARDFEEERFLSVSEAEKGCRGCVSRCWTGRENEDKKKKKNMSDTIVVRVQTKVGTWRLSDIPLSCTISQLKERIAAEYAVPADHQRISSDIRGKEEIPDSTSLKDLNARNGHRVFFSSDVEFGAGGGTGVKTGVDKNGNLVLKPADTAKRGFRPGLLPLSNIKRSWGIGEMEALDAQYTYEFKDPLKLECETCVMETQAADIFTTYAKQTKFAPRAAFLYGRYSEDGSSTEVHAIYEPPQSVDEFGAIEVHDEAPDAQLRVDAVARGLCLTKVGVMFCHAYRKTKTAMSSMEVLFAAEQQLESCDGDIDATPNRFVTVVVRQTEEGLADFQAFQVTRQCMEMVAKGMLLWGMEDPYQCDIHEMFTALTVKHNKEKTRVR